MAKFDIDSYYGEDSPNGETLGYRVARDNGRDYRYFPANQEWAARDYYNSLQALDNQEKMVKQQGEQLRLQQEILRRNVGSIYTPNPSYKPVVKEKTKEEINKESIQYYEYLIKSDPNNPDNYRKKAYCLTSYGLGRYEEAIKCYDKVIELEPNNSDNYKDKALALKSSKRYDEAIKCYDKAIELKPKEAFYYEEKARILDWYLNRYEDALYCYDKAIEVSPLTWYFDSKVKILKSLGRNEDIIKCYDKGAKLMPAYEYSFYQENADFLASLGKYDDAIVYYKKMVKYKSDDADDKYENLRIYEKIKGLYEKMGKRFDPITVFSVIEIKTLAKQGIYYDISIECYNKLIELEPNNPDNYRGKASLLPGSDEAIKCYDKLIELEPNNPDNYRSKASTLQHLGRFKEADKYNKKAGYGKYNKNHKKSNSSCYIATTCYGSIYADEVDRFRAYRDNYLVNSWLGRAFISFYYFTSPPIAKIVTKHEWMRKTIRKFILSPILKRLPKQNIFENK